MTSRRSAKFVLLVLAFALTGLGVLAWEPVWWWATTERKYTAFSFQSESHRGWERVSRWSGKRCGPAVFWHQDGAFKATEMIRSRDSTRMTSWNPDGTVRLQFYFLGDEAFPERQRSSPPWWWGVTDQTEPTMPEWMKDDARWQAALDAEQFR